MKSLYGLFGLALLIYAEYGINYYDEHYNDNVRWEFFLQYGGYCRYYRRGNEDDYHRVGKLREKTQNQRRFLALGKLVLPVSAERRRACSEVRPFSVLFTSPKTSEELSR